MLVDGACLQLKEGQKRISSWPHLHRATGLRLDSDDFYFDQPFNNMKAILELVFSGRYLRYLRYLNKFNV